MNISAQPSKLTLLSTLITLLIIPLSPKSVTEVISKLENYNIEFPQEKIYLHTDKGDYFEGETIWIKSYLVAGSFHQPSPLSNVVYIELISPKKELISSTVIHSENGLANSRIILPKNISGGTYLLRAYTNWMKNFGEEFFFQRNIRITNGENSIIEESTPMDENIDLQFFPEGGYLVDQVPTRLAFKAIDSKGNSFEAKGQIYDSKGQIIADFQSVHNGMGSFIFTPNYNEEYYAMLENSTEKISFPEIKKTGFSLSVSQSSQDDIIRLSLRSNKATKNKDHLNVLVHCRGSISHSFPLDLSKDFAFLDISSKKMLPGIQHITVFDKNGNPLLERLLFIKNKGTQVSINVDKEEYSPRDKTKADIKVVNEFGEPIKGNLSISVTDISQAPNTSKPSNIESELLLNSDLRGHIENPNYYFKDNSETTNFHLDLLMMTHGWSRFEWKSLLDNNLPKIDFLIEKGLQVKGTLKNNHDKPIPNGEVTYFDNSSTPPTIRTTSTDEFGNWNFFNIEAYDRTPVSFQGSNEKGKKNVRFEFDTDRPYTAPIAWNPVSITASKQLNESFIDNSLKREQIRESYQFDPSVILLDSFVVESERENFTKNEGLYGPGDRTFSYESLPTAAKQVINPIELLQGRVAGVKVDYSGPFATLTIRGATGVPAIYLNDMPTDLNTIIYTSAIDIERVEVFKSPSAAVFGSNGAYGVLAFYTYQGVSTKPMNKQEGFYTTILQNAYQSNRDFYSPKYDTPLPEHAMPDFRATVLWSPNVEIGENGIASVEFWNTDNEGQFKIDVQGISNSGQPITQTFNYYVEKK